MCFSAAASFGAGVVLSAIGIAATRKVKMVRHWPLATIPLLFGFQQFTEGLLWLSLKDPGWSQYQNIFKLTFLFIAQVLWPVWLPIAFLMFEKNAQRKKLLRFFLITGIILASYFFYCLMTFTSVASVNHHHIHYALDYPVRLVPFAAFMYILSTAGPGVFSTNSKVKWIGILILVFYVLSRAYFQPNLISVWCFFASVVGILAYIALYEENTMPNPVEQLAVEKT